MTERKLIGFVRKATSGKKLKVNVCKVLFNEATSYKSNNGEEYVSLLIDIDGILDLISEQREFIVLVQSIEEEEGGRTCGPRYSAQRDHNRVGSDRGRARSWDRAQ